MHVSNMCLWPNITQWMKYAITDYLRIRVFHNYLISPMVYKSCMSTFLIGENKYILIKFSKIFIIQTKNVKI